MKGKEMNQIEKESASNHQESREQIQYSDYLTQ